MTAQEREKPMTAQESDHMAYVAVKPCGCLVEARVDVPARRKEIARALRSWILEGLTVERISVEAVRQRWGPCPHEEEADGQEQPY